MAAFRMTDLCHWSDHDQPEMVARVHMMWSALRVYDEIAALAMSRSSDCRSIKQDHERRPDSNRQMAVGSPFLKTRSLARTAVDAGRVHLNGARVKPSRSLKEGDQLTITKGVERFDITIDQLSTRRGSATIAQALYTESDQSIERRKSEAQQRRLIRASEAAPAKRPDKRSRRQIKQFKQDSG